MPCHCEGACAYSAKKRTAELDRLTRVCCDMRTILRREALDKELTTETRSWIAEHDEADRKRIEKENAEGIRERTRLAALDKLSLEERRVLGL